MSTGRARMYRFASPAHWRRCLLHGLVCNPDGGLRLRGAPDDTLEPLWQPDGPAAGAVDLVVVSPAGEASWRIVSACPKRAHLQRLERGGASAPLQLDAPLATARRWVSDGSGLWTFDANRVHRHLADTLEPDCIRKLPAAEIVDIASDGQDGLFALIRNEGGRALIHLDCRGNTWPGVLPLPDELGNAVSLAPLAGGRRWAMLNRERKQLHYLDFRRPAPEYPFTFTWSHAVDLARLPGQPDANALHVRTDGAELTLLYSNQGIFILDASGDLLDLTLTDDAIHDAAVRRGALYVATGAGLFRQALSSPPGAREGAARLVTPVLHSPGSGTDKGWSRAEIELVEPLSPGAWIEARYFSTDDETTAHRKRLRANERSLSVGQRQLDICHPTADELGKDRHSGQTFTFTTDLCPGRQLDVPLYTCTDSWLWLELAIHAAPDAAPPVIRELRVRYPDVSLGEYLPAIYREPRHDPEGLARELVGILEATTQDFDRKIAGIGTRFDPDTAPPDWLDMIARWLGLPWNDALPEAARRRLLGAANALAGERGTRAGLTRLLGCLVDDGRVESVVDSFADHPPLPLGGQGHGGPRLPMLLPGTPPGLARTDSLSRLDATRLPGGDDRNDPLRYLVPTIRIHLATRRATREAIEPLLDGLLADYLPAGLVWQFCWRTLPTVPVPPGTLHDQDGEPLILEAAGPATLDHDSTLGRSVLAGLPTRRLDANGLAPGFRLH